MGGHGGLNILPQKRWNVYNFDNREKVRKDEEAAAKEEQIKREESRKRDSELRLQQLRAAKSGVIPAGPSSGPAELSPVHEVAPSVPAKLNPAVEEEPKSDSKHINLFEGIRIFDLAVVDEKKRKRREDEENERRKKMKKKKEEVRVIGPEDEKYKLGYGVAGKGVTAPWYTMKREVEREKEEEDEDGERKTVVKKKKTVEELREERLKREKAEKERQRALLSRNDDSHGRFSSLCRDRERKQWRTADRF